MNFGENLKKIRKKQNMTLSELAEKSGVTKSSISCYENNIRIPSITNVQDLSDALDVDINLLIGKASKKNQIKFVNESIIKELNEIVSELDYMRLKQLEYDFTLLLDFILRKYKLKE